MKRKYHGQMSESFVVGILLSLCGGFQDAYTYMGRDKVFANAQTGNIVLLGNHLAQGEWALCARYAIPVSYTHLDVYKRQVYTVYLGIFMHKMALKMNIM